jgi:hypothetical protein
LLIIASARNNSTDPDWVAATFNGSASDFTSKFLQGNGSTVSSSSLARLSGASSNASNTFSNFQVYIPNYTNSSISKSYSADYVTEANATLAYAVLVGGQWSNASAITSIALSCGNGSNSFTQYSNFYLYGIKNS